MAPTTTTTPGRALAGALLLLLSALPAAVQAACDRAAIKAVTDGYIAAQAAGSTSPLAASLTDATAYTENFKRASPASGILAQALHIDHSRSSYDAAQCASYTELIVAGGAHPYVIGTQLWLSNDSSASASSSGTDDANNNVTAASPTIAKMETLVTDRGDWLFNATGTLYWASRESWAPIQPESARDARAAIRAAADAYLDYFRDKSVKVPWGTPCARLEGGSYTGTGAATDSCNVGVPSGVSLTDRRYVVDEVVGAVDVFLSFQGLPDSHEFRVEGGKLRFVHTLTVMQ